MGFIMLYLIFSSNLSNIFFNLEVIYLIYSRMKKHLSFESSIFLLVKQFFKLQSIQFRWLIKKLSFETFPVKYVGIFSCSLSEFDTINQSSTTFNSRIPIFAFSSVDQIYCFDPFASALSYCKCTYQRS